MRINLLTFVGFHINGALGTGRYNDISIADIKARIRDRTVFEYLGERIEDFDISLLTNDDQAELLAEWNGMLEIDEARKLNVDENGLCLLMAYLLEGIQRRARAGGV